MALSPIQMFQNNQSSLAQILQGGNQTLTGILDKAVQIGRDMTNNQLAQERDMLGMRAQETALFQRRAENLQQNNEDAQNFARRAFESDRRYGLEERQMSSTEQARLAAQSNDDARLGLAERGMAVTEGAFDLRKQEEERKMNFSRGLIDGGTAEAAPEKEQSFGGKLVDWFTGGAFKSEPKVDEGALRGELEVVTAQVAAAKEAGDPEKYQSLLRRRGELVGQITEAGKVGRRATGLLTDNQKLMAAERARKAQEKAGKDAIVATDKKLEVLVDDAVAFPSAVITEANKTIKGETEVQQRARLEVARKRDASPLTRWKNDAEEAANEDAFVNAVEGAGDKEKELRRNFYREYMATKTGSAAGTGAPKGAVARSGID